MGLILLPIIFSPTKVDHLSRSANGSDQMRTGGFITWLMLVVAGDSGRSDAPTARTTRPTHSSPDSSGGGGYIVSRGGEPGGSAGGEMAATAVAGGGTTTKKIGVALVALLVMVAIAADGAAAQACGSTFFSALVQLMPCRPAVTPFSPAPPSEACCNALKTLGRPCLCLLVNGPPISGVDRNMAKELPAKCTVNFDPCSWSWNGLKQIPPAVRCRSCGRHWGRGGGWGDGGNKIIVTWRTRQLCSLLGE